ncbi:hypothetical protein BH10BAC2_BH10BAC2_07860 [soil metagenome]
MRKNIWVLLALSVSGCLTLTSCSKKSVVPPKQTEKSAANLSKPGSTGSTTTTTTNQNHGSGSCDGSYNGVNDAGTTSAGH